MMRVDYALACRCDSISPSLGFDRAQYGFTGTVVSAEHHMWLVATDRVWKGREKRANAVRLMDAFAATDCEFLFERGRGYLFFAVMGKGVLGKGRDIFFHPQICSWTRPLQTSRFVTGGNESLWIEDFIVREHGSGEPPPDEPH